MSEGGLLLHIKLLLQNASLKGMSVEHYAGNHRLCQRACLCLQHKWSTLKDDPELLESSLLDLEWDRAATIIAYSLLNHCSLPTDILSPAILSNSSLLQTPWI
ncbi:hypothetical protein PAXRUDRAFT_18480 [Paxillus rubicundulus Ve08.2h10]|uniref:Uncharacterized protein n=1 Tax=Paxillus rubicundulus Ve08.2h10 TaxID=930991 RepID=A0A0D0DEQ3_9AGAM|nr:hypothetical protein PAXRUDRAFT_18480 [Paxillus rubicundulus Ve08.2h10]